MADRAIGDMLGAASLGERLMSTEPSALAGRRPLLFCVLVTVLSLPFWGIGAATGLQLFSGLPFAAVMFFLPGLVALILTWRADGRAAAGRLLRRAGDWDRVRPRAWLLAAALLAPAVIAAGCVIQRLTGVTLAAAHISPLTAGGLFLLFLFAGVCEELGWSGYLIEPLQARWGALPASLVVGAVWAGWHLVPLVQAHRAADWIAWWCLSTLAMRVIMVWLYNSAGRSVFAVALFHGMSNLATLLVPAWNNQKITSVLEALVALAVVLIAGPRTLAGRRPQPAAAE